MGDSPGILHNSVFTLLHHQMLKGTNVNTFSTTFLNSTFSTLQEEWNADLCKACFLLMKESWQKSSEQQRMELFSIFAFPVHSLTRQMLLPKEVQGPFLKSKAIFYDGNRSTNLSYIRCTNNELILAQGKYLQCKWCLLWKYCKCHNTIC